MTQQTEIERAAQTDSQAATAHNHVALTDDELAQVAGGTEGPPGTAGDHNGSR